MIPILGTNQTQPGDAHRVAIGFPCSGAIAHADVAHALYHASYRHQTTILRSGGTWENFNTIWAAALGLAQEGRITHFAMLHADCAAQEGWLDVLLDEADRLGADLVSAICPQKGFSGITSSGIGDPADPFHPWKRFTMREVCSLPETFWAADVGAADKWLLHNDACFVIDLRNPKVFSEDAEGNVRLMFDFPKRVRKIDGRYMAEAESEDWYFSRKAHELGLLTCITRKVKLSHWGQQSFRNDIPWGTWDHDEGTRGKWGQVAAGHGAWSDPTPEAHQYDPTLADALVAFLRDQAAESVLDLGCGAGDYVRRFKEAGLAAVGVDGNPHTPEWGEDLVVADLAEPVAATVPAEWVVSLEVGEHIPAERESVFLDNVAGNALCGVVLSWAVPGQPGRGHVNCQDNAHVVAEMTSRGFQRDEEAERRLRSAATLPWYKDTLMVFYNSKRAA